MIWLVLTAIPVCVSPKATASRYSLVPLSTTLQLKPESSLLTIVPSLPTATKVWSSTAATPPSGPPCGKGFCQYQPARGAPRFRRRPGRLSLRRRGRRPPTHPPEFSSFYHLGLQPLLSVWSAPPGRKACRRHSRWRRQLGDRVTQSM